MDEENFLAERFQAHRRRLRGVAYRMLGSIGEAEDAVQETWLRLAHSEAGEIANFGGWLTTVVGRVCLDMLRARKSRREDSLDADEVPEPMAPGEGGGNPESEALMADSVGAALLVVLEMLTPAERIAFVLHDMFELPFDEIGPIVGRSSTAVRQLASRARRRVQGRPAAPEPDLGAQRRVVEAFLAAARGGDMGGLLAVLDPEVVFRADAAVVRLGARSELRGADAVAKTFAGRAQGARAALVDGTVGVVVVPNGKLLVVLGITLSPEGRIVAIDAIADPAELPRIEVAAFAD